MKDEDEIQNAEDCYEELRQYTEENIIGDTRWSEDTPSGNNYWSNTNIISGLTDNKIKQQITYYKQMVGLLEEELRLRTLGRRIYVEFSPPHFDGTRSNSTSTKTRHILRHLRPRLQYIRKRNGKVAFDLVQDTWRKILEVYFREENVNNE